MRRYEIRSEYGLGDPELYKSAASEDDPESILEGVAMAGLVGLLRQLGDLAQFAAEIFHDLHEEAMVTSARSHGLMVRVQQLEAEFPEIEKAFLTKTDHSSFFSNPGVEWHPNLRTEQNLITRGDLPRFVMDSYEECRGPPRLFLLDKYDVAGAGACLKRYTDPSIFKLEAVSTGIANVDVQKEKKSRKVKKKGSRWRNGATPDIRPSSHAKLHQLLLEERIQNNWSEPARSVKLKRRQYNDLPVDSKTGKSYMEKFIQNSSPDNGALCDASVCPLPLKFASESSSDSGHDTVDIGTVSPLKKSSPSKGNTHFSPAMYKVLKLSVNVTNHEIVDAPQSTVDVEKMDRPSALCDMISEEELAVDGESKTGDSGYDDHSDDSPSETENYMDALATMESEIDTDNEYRLNRVMSLSKANTHLRDSDANEEGSYIQPQYSDSQSLGNFSATDDGNRSVKRGGSSISYSDTHSTVAESMPSDTIAELQLFPSSKAGIAETVHMPHNQCTASVEVPGDQSHNRAQNAVYISDDKIHDSGGLSMFSPDNTCIEKDGISNVGELSYDACVPDSNYIRHTMDFELATGIDEDVSNLGTSIIASSIPTQSKDDAFVSEFTEVCAVDQLSDGHSKSSSGVLPWRSRNVDTYHEKESSNDEVVQRESASESSDETLVCEKTRLPQSTILGPREQLASSSSHGIRAVSGIPVSHDAALNLESSTPKLETSLADNSGRQKLVSDVDSAEEVIFHKTSRVGGEEQTSELPSNASAVQVDLSHNSLDHRDVNSNSDTPEKAVVKDIDVSTSVTSEDVLLESSDKKLSQDLGTKLEPPGFEVPQCRGWESDDIISVERCKESVEQMDSKLEIPPSDVESDHCESQKLDTCDNNCSQSGAQETTGVFLLDDGTTVFVSSQASCMNPELKYAGHECNLESGGDDRPYSTFHLSDPAVSSNQSPELPADESKLKHSQEDETTSNSKLQDREMKSIDCANLEEQNDASVKISSDKFKTQPSPLQFSSETAIDPIGETPTPGFCTETGRENHVSCSAEILTQPSACDVESQSDNQELAGTKLIAPSLSVNLDPGYLHKGTEFNPASSQSTSDGFQLQLAQSESLLQSVDMEVTGNKHIVDELDSIHPNFLLLQEETQDSHASSNTSQVDIISCSSPESLLLTSDLEEGGTQQAAHALNFAMPCIVLPPVAPNISIEDAPPLPPLPPMQWRMGKMQNPPQNSEKESFEPSGISLTSSMLQQSIEGESQFGAGDSAHHLPPAFPLAAAEDMDRQRRSESFPNNLVPLHGISRQSTEKISDKNSPTTEEVHSPKPFLAEQPMSNEKAKDIGASEFTSLQSGHNSSSPTENLAASDSETKTVHLNVQNSEEQRNIRDTFVVGEQSQNCLQISDGEMAPSLDSSSEIAASEVGKPKKIPRPRSPLIDAVAAHDRSTLRKVTERVQPQVTPKVDERDSLLDQIRNKSFNLKPAAVNRPIIRGPKTNLNVAAILEKAHQIRQALAGSDEDDADSWSDS